MLTMLVRGQPVSVRADEVTLLRATHKLVEVCTAQGRVGWISNGSVSSLMRSHPGRWLLLRHGVAVAPGAIRRIERIKSGGYVVRVTGSSSPIAIARRHVAAIRASVIPAPETTKPDAGTPGF